MIGGQLHRGWTGGAGEVGFMPVPGTPLVRRVTRSDSGGFQELAGGRAVSRLARELGIAVPAGATYTDEAIALIGEASRAAGGPYRELLRSFATGIATGLASVVAILDPELIVLSGGVLVAGGEPLRALVQAELAELAAPRPRLVVGSVQEQPVLRGALESALATTRDEVFDTTSR